MNKQLKYFLFVAFACLFWQCTDDFDEINTNPNGFTKDEVSAKYFLTGPQFNLFAPNRYPYWRMHLIHMDRFSGHVCFGHTKSWWNDGLGYSYSGGYSNASWGWINGQIGGIDNFLKLTKSGGEFENEKMYAVGLIIKGLYYQMFTDVYGMVVYTEAGNPDITQPKLDDQKTIYQGVIADLNQAMSIIGDAERTGVAGSVDDLGENDLYFDGDLQKWKKLANSLKLRMATRALGAPGASFAEGAIKEALAGPLMESGADNALLVKDEEISQWGSAAYGDVWHNFGAGSDWTMGKSLIDPMIQNNDPRLAFYARPAVGGEVTITKPAEGEDADLFEKRAQFLIDHLTASNADFTYELKDDALVINMAKGVNYVGQPSRTNSRTKPFMVYDLFSRPAEEVVQKKGSGSIRPEIIFTTAEAYFLRAEAAVRGIGGDDAQEMYSKGIEESMKLWGVGSGDIETYLANAPLAKLDGSAEENINKIATQKYIMSFTDGFEGWAHVRKYGVPSDLHAGVTDYDIYSVGTIDGHYPQRMRYGSALFNTNGDNANAAVATQGPDLQDTKLWWAK